MNLIKLTFQSGGLDLPIYFPVTSLDGGYFKPAFAPGSAWAKSQIFLANGANLLVIETVEEITSLIASVTATVGVEEVVEGGPSTPIADAAVAVS